MRVKLVFNYPDERAALDMEALCMVNPHLKVLPMKSNEWGKVTDLDALYVTIMAAEQWGAFPIIHQAQVLSTKPEDRASGWPPFVVAGVAMTKDDPRDPMFELSLIIGATLDGVTKFNDDATRKIFTVGFTYEWIGLKRLPVREAAKVILESYDAFYSD